MFRVNVNRWKIVFLLFKMNDFVIDRNRHLWAREWRSSCINIYLVLEGTRSYLLWTLIAVHDIVAIVSIMLLWVCCYIDSILSLSLVQPQPQYNQHHQHTLLSSHEHQITLQRPFIHQNVNISTTKTKQPQPQHHHQQYQPQKRCDYYAHDLLKQVQKHQHHLHHTSYHRPTYDNNNHSINYHLNISNHNDDDEQPNYLSSRPFTKAPPYYKNINGEISKSDAYIENLRTPIKMQQQEYIIEHSQLVLQRNGNRTETNAVHRSDHYMQVTQTRWEKAREKLRIIKKNRLDGNRFI